MLLLLRALALGLALLALAPEAGQAQNGPSIPALNPLTGIVAPVGAPSVNYCVITTAQTINGNMYAAGDLAVPCGTHGTSASGGGSATPAQGAFAATSGTTTSASATTTYQLFAAGTITVGGAVVNTSAPGTGPIYVDRDGATSTTACPPSKGSLPVYPAASATTAPGSLPLLPSTKAVTWCGPVGSTVQADGG